MTPLLVTSSLHFLVLPYHHHLRHCSLLFVGGRFVEIYPEYSLAQIAHDGSLEEKIVMVVYIEDGEGMATKFNFQMYLFVEENE